VVRPVDDGPTPRQRRFANDIMQRPQVARPRPHGARWLLLLLGSLSLVGCHRRVASHGHHRRHGHSGLTLPSPAVEVDAEKLKPFSALPASFASKDGVATPEMVALGRQLYSETRLSKDAKTSCNHCHDLDRYGVDGEDSSPTNGPVRERNTPSVLDAALEFAEFWDGRADTIEAATEEEMSDPSALGWPTSSRFAPAVKALPAYAASFGTAFPDQPNPISIENAARAVAAFERTLLTPSPWDRFVAGEKTALSDAEKRGFLDFVSVGCSTCHVGPLVGGTMYQKLGKENPWPNQRDQGRAEVTKVPADALFFKVAPLRNVEKTAPYFHDASAKTLPEAVKSMAHFQLNKELGTEQLSSIVAFLGSLTGSVPGADSSKTRDATVAPSPSAIPDASDSAGTPSAPRAPSASATGHATP